MKAHARLALIALAALAACAGQDEVGTESEALSVKSQLRGYDLGPPFPAGFRDSGLVNGYAENEWVPFVAVMDAFPGTPEPAVVAIKADERAEG